MALPSLPPLSEQTTHIASNNTTTTGIMASAARYCPSCLARTTTLLGQPAIRTIESPSQTLLRTLPSALQTRSAVTSANAQKYRRKDQPTSTKRRKPRTSFLAPDLKNAIQFSLLDAMRYCTPPPNLHHPVKPAPNIDRYIVDTSAPPKSAAVLRRPNTKSTCASARSKTGP
jgi:hypothetical protein